MAFPLPACSGRPRKKYLSFLFILVAVFFFFFSISCATVQKVYADIKSEVSDAFDRKDTDTSSKPSQPSEKASVNKTVSEDTNWDLALLDTARNVPYLKDVEKDVILEMNKVRSDPKKYAELYIKPQLKYYSGNRLSFPGQTTIITKEGSKAVEECIRALSQTKSCRLLAPEKGLALGAADHVKDQGPRGSTGHYGQDGSSPSVRVGRYGKGSFIGENISYGSNTGRQILIQLLVDDGVPSRGHRTNIMEARFSQTGVAFGSHKTYRAMCVIVYADKYSSNE